MGEPTAIDIIASTNPDGSPFAGCPRTTLKKVIALAAENGYRMKAGPEAEFFLFQMKNGEPTTESHDSAGYFDLSPVDLGEDVRREIVLALEAMGFHVEAAHHEVAPGQHEIDFRYDDVLTAVRTEPGLHGAQVLALNPLTLEDVFADIRRIGLATGTADAAARYAAALAARVQAVRAVTDRLAADERPRVACVEWIEPLMLAANWMPDLIEIAGGRQTFAAAGRHSVYHAWEEVTAFDPEVIVLMPCGFNLPRTVEEATVLASRPGWRSLAAVRQHRVYAVDGNQYFNRSGPRLVDSLEILAHLLHPDLFPLPAREGAVEQLIV